MRHMFCQRVIIGSFQCGVVHDVVLVSFPEIFSV